MNNWHCEDFPVNKLNEIQDAFNVIRIKSGLLVDMAIFYKSIPESPSLMKVYFSPAALEAAQAFKARPCQKPSPPIMLLAGDQKALHIFFPEIAL